MTQASKTRTVNVQIRERRSDYTCLFPKTGTSRKNTAEVIKVGGHNFDRGGASEEQFCVHSLE
jgi:hypothetical protein